MSVHLQVNINDATSDALDELSERHGISWSEVINRAVAVYHQLEPALATATAIRLVDSREAR